jgi:glyoxylase-like metal-dependent hydrolase (beta-lactamase superfamily II)
MPLTVQSFQLSPFAENTYIVHDGTEAALIDPGSSNRAERDVVEHYLRENGLRVRQLLLTHGHIDHIFGCAYFGEKLGATADHGGWQMHEADLDLIRNAAVTAEAYGVRLDQPPDPTHLLADGDTVELGATSFEVIHLPGHSPGSVGFYSAEEGVLISGDVLFQGSIGRTDLWKGSMPQLIRSIRERVLTLPDDTRVLSGHGAETTVGDERRSNPFLA